MVWYLEKWIITSESLFSLILLTLLSSSWWRWAEEADFPPQSLSEGLVRKVGARGADDDVRVVRGELVGEPVRPVRSDGEQLDEHPRQHGQAEQREGGRGLQLAPREAAAVEPKQRAVVVEMDGRVEDIPPTETPVQPNLPHEQGERVNGSDSLHQDGYAAVEVRTLLHHERCSSGKSRCGLDNDVELLVLEEYEGGCETGHLVEAETHEGSQEDLGDEGVLAYHVLPEAAVEKDVPESEGTCQKSKQHSDYPLAPEHLVRRRQYLEVPVRGGEDARENECECEY